MNHFELSAAVHAIAREAGAQDSHTTEACTVPCNGKAPHVSYHAQVWFKWRHRDGENDSVCVTGATGADVLRQLRDGLRDRETTRAALAQTEPAPC